MCWVARIARRLALLFLFAGAALCQQVTPGISISSPSDGAVFLPGSTIALTATGLASQSSVARVEFLANGQLIGTAVPSAVSDGRTYTVSWNNVHAGVYALTAQVTDSGGLRSASSAVVIYVSAIAPQPVSLDGVFEQVIEDHFSEGTSVTHYGVNTSAGHYTLIFPDPRMAEGILSGSRVHVNGITAASSVRVNKIPATSESSSVPRAVGGLHADIFVLSAPASTVTSGIRKIAILLVNLSDDRSQPMTQAIANQTIATLNQYFQESSYGAMGLGGDVYGYFQLPMAVNCTVGDYFTEITTAAIQAAQSAGVDLLTRAMSSWERMGPPVPQDMRNASLA